MGVLRKSLSVREQLAYDDAVAYATKVDEAERAHYAALPDVVRREKQEIAAALDEGRIFVANPLGDSITRIHYASCGTIRHQIDRDIAHELEYEREGKVDGSWHAGSGVDYVSKWPQLVTIEQVEALPAYVACLTCNPPTLQRKKKRVHALKPTMLRSIGRSHLGREFETPAGEYLGTLSSYTVSEALIVLHCSGRDYRGTEETQVIMRPREQVATL